MYDSTRDAGSHEASVGIEKGVRARLRATLLPCRSCVRSGKHVNMGGRHKSSRASRQWSLFTRFLSALHRVTHRPWLAPLETVHVSATKLNLTCVRVKKEKSLET